MRQRIILILYVLICCNYTVPVSANTKTHFETGTFYKGSFFHMYAPRDVNHGRILFDVTTQQNIDRIMYQLTGIGLNFLIQVYAVLGDRAYYPTAIEELTYSPAWKALGKDAVMEFLDACLRHDIRGFLGIVPHTFRDVEQRERVSLRIFSELLERYGRHTAWYGYFPSVESSPVHDTWREGFHRVISDAKTQRPDLIICDVPDTPYDVRDVIASVEYAKNPNLDMMMMEYALPHTGEYPLLKYKYYLVRALALLSEASMQGKPTIMHTNPMTGWHKLATPKEHLWKWEQGVRLTVLAAGTHLEQYLTAMNGTDWRQNEDGMGRRLAWYRAMMSIDRLQPFLAEAEHANDISIMLPRYPRFETIELADFVWAPLLFEHITAGFCYNQTNIGTPKVLVVPMITGLDADQVQTIGNFARNGGTVIVLVGPISEEAKELAAFRYPRMIEVSEELLELCRIKLGKQMKPNRILTVPMPGKQVVKIKPSMGYLDGWNIDSGYIESDRGHRGYRMEAYGFPLIPQTDDVEVLATWGSYSRGQEDSEPWAVTRTPIGKGQIVVMPRHRETTVDLLPNLVRYVCSDLIETEGLPSGVLVEHYVKKTVDVDHDLLLVMTHTEGQHTGSFILTVPVERFIRRVYRIDDGNVSVPDWSIENGTCRIQMDNVVNYAALVLAGESGTYPILQAQQNILDCSVGQAVTLSCALINSWNGDIEGTLIVEGPPGWNTQLLTDNNYLLRPDEKHIFTVRCDVPADAENNTYFVVFKTLGLEARSVLFPVDGKQRQLD